MNGDKIKTAAALVPHQSSHDSQNEELNLKTVSVVTPMKAPSMGLNTTAKPRNPSNSLSVPSVGRAATSRRISHALDTA
jgi:hypothetical protein